jgi:hypothetical protein
MITSVLKVRLHSARRQLLVVQMSLSPAVSTTVLGKRKATTYVLHLAASSPSEHQSEPKPFTSTANLAVHDPPQTYSKKARNPCTYSGCSKSYSKASRLAEHIRSHTGEVIQFRLLRYVHYSLNSSYSVPTCARLVRSPICANPTFKHM